MRCQTRNHSRGVGVYDPVVGIGHGLQGQAGDVAVQPVQQAGQQSNVVQPPQHPGGYVHGQHAARQLYGVNRRVAGAGGAQGGGAVVVAAAGQARAPGGVVLGAGGIVQPSGRGAVGPVQKPPHTLEVVGGKQAFSIRAYQKVHVCTGRLLGGVGLQLAQKGAGVR